jgi:hypothetical protein
VYGDRSGIEALLRFAREHQPEAILFAGGILCQERRVVPCASSPFGLTLEDERFVHEFLAALEGLRVFSAVIPGPNFEPLDEFCRIGIAAELEFPHVHIAHATLVEEQDLAVCGLGVAIAEEALMREDSYSRIRALYFLRPLRMSVKPRKVLLLSEPPPGVLGGPKGNTVVAEIIDSLRPNLCVVAGRTERRGLQWNASTLIVNPGSLADHSAALLDWVRASVDQVEFLNPRGSAALSLQDSSAAPCGPLGAVEPAQSVSPEDIRLRAYLLWVAAGRPVGKDVSFWCEAEKELASR